MRKKLIVGALLLGSMLSGCEGKKVIGYKCVPSDVLFSDQDRYSLVSRMRTDSETEYWYNTNNYYQTLEACEADGRYSVETQ